MTDGITSTEVYDALGRVVEHQIGGFSQQVVYGPGGDKVALMGGSTLQWGYVPLPGGGHAMYDATGLVYYRRPDYLGSSRLASKPNRTLYSSGAYAPYGEDYAAAGTRDVNFTGQDQMVLWGIYDFMYRRYDAGKGPLDLSRPRRHGGSRSLESADVESVRVCGGESRECGGPGRVDDESRLYTLYMWRRWWRRAVMSHL